MEESESTEKADWLMIFLTLAVVLFLFNHGRSIGKMEGRSQSMLDTINIIQGNIQRNYAEVHIPRSIIDQINKTYSEDYPLETAFCLYGTKNSIEGGTRYLIDSYSKPKITKQTEEEIRSLGCTKPRQVRILMHSHPSGLKACRPSDYDYLLIDGDVEGLICGGESFANKIIFYDQYGFTIEYSRNNEMESIIYGNLLEVITA